MSNQYDAIVVGARCAGSPTAMLLARKGYSVLLVDRATFPSDTISTHLVHPPGVASLRRWGLLDRITATGCPPIHTYAFDFGAFTLAVRPAIGDAPVAYGPRRTVLDKLLVDAASRPAPRSARGSASTKSSSTDGRVSGIRGRGRDGRTVTEHARVVVGADGRHSLVARAAQAGAVPRQAAAAVRLLQLLERRANAVAASRPTAAQTAHSRRGRPTTA